MNDYRTFLIPYDFSEGAHAALFAAMDLARRLKADCHLLHVVQSVAYPAATAGAGGLIAAPSLPPPNLLEVRDSALESLGDVVSAIENPPGRVVPHVVEDGNVAGAICEMAAKLEADLIVMGTRGRTGLAHVFLGSVAERTLRHAPCPVLTVPEPDPSTRSNDKEEAQ
jgi:nucleotide-binding universal stress UspA family protein